MREVFFPSSPSTIVQTTQIEDMWQSIRPSALEVPSADEAGNTTVRVVPAGDTWVQLGQHWVRIRTMQWWKGTY